MVQLIIIVPKELKDEFKILTIKENKSMSKICRSLIERYIEDKKPKQIVC